jgi:hypothetical protein
MLVRAVPRELHCELFGVDSTRVHNAYFRTVSEGPSMLGCITEKLQNQLADKIIRNIIATCQTMNCMPTCTAKYHQTFDEVLSAAILKNNFGLVEYLFSRIQPTVASLTAAIRCGRIDLIELMLKQRNCVGGEAVCCKDMFRADLVVTISQLPHWLKQYVHKMTI